MDNSEILSGLNSYNRNTMMEWMNIEYVDYTGDTLTAEMPIDSKVHQPYGIVHGGATAALAETVGSALSGLQFPNKEKAITGTNLNIYHLSSAKDGKAIAIGSFIRKGRSLHIIKIQIFDGNNKQLSEAILTTKVITYPKHL